MKMLTLWQMEIFAWYVFAAYWLITALKVRRTKARETSIDRFLTVAVVVIAYELLFANWLRIGPLRMRFVPQHEWIGQLGFAVTWVGVAIAIWARYCIGEYWSARVTLKEGHRLIRSGPYAFVRHPIYTGMLLGCVGAALVIGEWRGILAIVLLLAAHSRKALREESLLTTEFGEEYSAYRRGTGFLFPRFFRRRPNGHTPRTTRRSLLRSRSLTVIASLSATGELTRDRRVHASHRRGLASELSACSL